MFDVGFDEMLLVVVVAIVVIGPKDLPRAMRTVGRWVGKARRMSNHFRAGVEAMVREAEMEDLEKQWREQNAAIMAAYPDQDVGSDAKAAGEAAQAGLPAPKAAQPVAKDTAATDPAPQLPLDGKA